MLNWVATRFGNGSSQWRSRFIVVFVVEFDAGNMHVLLTFFERKKIPFLNFPEFCLRIYLEFFLNLPGILFELTWNTFFFNLPAIFPFFNLPGIIFY